MTLTREEYIFLVVFAVNLLVAVLYLIWGIVWVSMRPEKEEQTEELRDNRRAYLLRSVVMVFCPVIGPLFFLIAHVLYLTIFRFQVDLEDVIFRKDRVKTQLKADEDRERNVIPVEEAIVVNDKRSLRLAMMNIIKGDMYGSLASIALALGAEDSETAHYAASALSDILNEFRMNVHGIMQKIQEEEPDQTEHEEELLDYMNDVLRQGVFTNLEQDRFVHMMEETAQALYEKDPDRLTQERYENICLRLLEINDFENSGKWCIRLSQQYPDQLPAYTCRLKLYFTTRNREAFFETIDALKKSDIIIDSETLEMIRIFG